MRIGILLLLTTAFSVGEQNAMMAQDTTSVTELKRKANVRGWDNPVVEFMGIELFLVKIDNPRTNGPELFLKPLTKQPKLITPETKYVSMGQTVYEIESTGFKGQLDPLFQLRVVGTKVPPTPLKAPDRNLTPNLLPAPSLLPSPLPSGTKDGVKDGAKDNGKSFPLPMPSKVPATASPPSLPTYPSVPTIPSVPTVPSFPTVPSLPNGTGIPSVPAVPTVPVPKLPPSIPSPGSELPKGPKLTASGPGSVEPPPIRLLEEPVFADGTTYSEYQRKLKEKDDAIPRSKGPLPDLDDPLPSVPELPGKTEKKSPPSEPRKLPAFNALTTGRSTK